MNRREFMKQTLAATAVAASGALLAPSVPAASPAATQAAGGTMNILVLTGSPRKNGNSSILADHFIKGARESGHTVTRFDAAFSEVHPCTACNSCGMDGPCVFEDDFEIVRKHILTADMVVFVTPMHYFGISAKLKTVIDRFYAITNHLHVPKKAALMVTYADNSKRKESAIATHYEVLLEYFGWQDAGRLFAPGVWPAGSIRSTSFPQQAYELGKNV